MDFFNLLKSNFFKFKNKRIIKNFNSQISLNVALTISHIFFPSLMIMIYGLENFGIWIFLTAIPSTVAILNFNLNGASRTEMSIYYNKKDKNKVNEIFNNSIILTFFFVLLLIFLTFIIIKFYDFNLKILNNLSLSDLKLMLICIFGSFYLNIINTIFKTGITYWGRLDIDTYLEIIFDIFSKILIVILGIIFDDLLFASFALLIASILKIITFYLFFINYNSFLSLFSFKLVSRKQVKKLLKLSIPYYLESLSGIIKNSFQIIILGIFFNANIVGMISTLRTLFYFLPIRVWGVVGKVIFYEFTKLYTEKKFKLFKKLYNNFLKLCFSFVCLFILSSILFGDYIYSFWLSNSYNLSFYLLFIIILDVSFYIVAGSKNLINKSINKFLNISVFSLMIEISIISLSFIIFTFGYSFYSLFLFNLIGSTMIMFFSIYSSNKLISKISG